MDIWAIKHNGRWLVHFLSEDAQAWAKHSEYYADLQPHAGIWMDPGEYEELQEGLVGTSLILLADSEGKEH